MPDEGKIPLTLGATRTVKLMPLLLTPPTFTTTLPLWAPLGTVTPIEVALQLDTVAVVPLNVTVLDPCVEPKFAPVMVTDAPTAPLVGFRLVMLGAANDKAEKNMHIITTPASRTVTCLTVQSFMKGPYEWCFLPTRISAGRKAAQLANRKR